MAIGEGFVIHGGSDLLAALTCQAKGEWPTANGQPLYDARVPHVIAEPCIDVKDGACVDVCPVHCIETTADSNMFFIDPDRCIDCRICALVCPVEAVFSNYDLPPDWARFERVNLEFFRRRA